MAVREQCAPSEQGSSGNNDKSDFSGENDVLEILFGRVGERKELGRLWGLQQFSTNRL